jgi:hypothetical protein
MAFPIIGHPGSLLRLQLKNDPRLIAAYLASPEEDEVAWRRGYLSLDVRV